MGSRQCEQTCSSTVRDGGGSAYMLTSLSEICMIIPENQAVEWTPIEGGRGVRIQAEDAHPTTCPSAYGWGVTVIMTPMAMRTDTRTYWLGYHLGRVMVTVAGLVVVLGPLALALYVWRT
jgi:hypothetical protein